MTHDDTDRDTRSALAEAEPGIRQLLRQRENEISRLSDELQRTEAALEVRVAELRDAMPPAAARLEQELEQLRQRTLRAGRLLCEDLEEVCRSLDREAARSGLGEQSIHATAARIIRGLCERHALALDFSIPF